MQQAFPDIQPLIQGASKLNQAAGLVLTNKGGELSEQ